MASPTTLSRTAVPANSPDRLGICTGNDELAMDQAVAQHRRNLERSPLENIKRVELLRKLAIALHKRSEQFGGIIDLEEAIAHSYHALALSLPRHPDRSASLVQLANILSTRFDQLGHIEDLEDAITYSREALALCPPSHPDRSVILNNLAVAVCSRFRQLGQIEDLEEAIRYNREVLTLYPPGHSFRSICLNNLAGVVFTRFRQLGQIEDLEESIECGQQALALCPPGHPHRSTFLNTLVNAVFARFEQSGQIEDLEQAIKYNREALSLRPPGHPSRFSSLGNLANAVFTRFEQLGQLEDLERAIEYHRDALACCPLDHPGRPTSLSNLAGVIFNRFQQLGQIEDLEEAIGYNQQAITLRPPGHPDRSTSLGNLGAVILARFEELEQIQDLEEAINYSRQALALCPPGHPLRSASLRNLAGAISTRFEQLGQREDIEDVVQLSSDAEKALPSFHPGHAKARTSLATDILNLCRHSPQSDHTVQMISNAFALFESAVHHSTSSSYDQFLAALRWAQEARRCRHPSVLRAYSTTLTCLDRRITLTPTIHSWQKFLSGLPRSLASDAASAAIVSGNLKIAVELLEQGRAILWSKMRGFRHPLHQLREMDAHLADEFDRVSRDLERHVMSFETESPPPGFYDRQTKRHRILSMEWDEVVRRIRQIEGFTNFLQAVPFCSLQLAATEGPVIVVNISQYRSDAIILQSSGPLVLVPLPNASPDALRELSQGLSSASTQDRDRDRPIRPILGHLWDLVVSPVVDQLATLGVAEKSRIWWCPTSELCGLPLHAAGPYKRERKNLPDLYTSSYTPTLSSLIRARSHVVHRPTAPKVLAMGQPNDNLEKSKLPQVREELSRIGSLGNFVDVLIGDSDNANRKTLLPLLQHYPWVHFCCHGHLAAGEPFRSSFELHDNDLLTLGDLIKARLSNAEFAFLSACHTAAINDNTPDEAIHLAAALQFCGFRSVVGTLWAIADVDGPDVAEDFYRYMFRKPGSVGDFKDAAVALNHATREMRKRGVPIDRWITFIHIGA